MATLIQDDRKSNQFLCYVQRQYTDEVQGRRWNEFEADSAENGSAQMGMPLELDFVLFSASHTTENEF